MVVIGWIGGSEDDGAREGTRALPRLRELDLRRTRRGHPCVFASVGDNYVDTEQSEKKQ